MVLLDDRHQVSLGRSGGDTSAVVLVGVVQQTVKNQALESKQFIQSVFGRIGKSLEPAAPRVDRYKFIRAALICVPEIKSRH